MKVTTILIILALLTSANTATARDSRKYMSLEEAFNEQNYKDKLDQGIKFYFGDQKYPKVLSSRGEYITNKKTNAFNKSDLRACQWALLSALISLQDRAISEGGNAVVDIVSYYKKREYSSATEYECHAGNVIAGVALKGRVVTLPE